VAYRVQSYEFILTLPTIYRIRWLISVKKVQEMNFLIIFVA